MFGTTTLRSDLYPPIEPSQTGRLPLSGGHSMYWEVMGNPKGPAVVFLHGGPGAGAAPDHRRFFDPAHYRIVVYDQRGAGRSTPLGEVRDNTTQDLIADLERLREHLGLEDWLVFGGSWGSTLALAYAQAHPARVTELVLAPVTTSSRAEIDWLYGQAGRLLPAAFEAFRAGAPEVEPGMELVEAYAERLLDPDPKVHHKAAQDWCRWEAALVEVDPRAEPSQRWQDPAFRLTFACLVTHTFRQGAWLEDGQLLRDLPAISEIPAALIHSRLDLSAPLSAAWALAKAWPAAELTVIEGGLHGATTAPMAAAIIAALDRFARGQGRGWGTQGRSA